MRELSAVRVAGPLVPYVEGYGRHLAALGYTRLSVLEQVRLLAHVSRWVAAEGLGVEDFTPQQVSRFVRARRDAGYTSRRAPGSLSVLLGYLQELGAVPVPEPPLPETPVQTLLARYHDYLVSERGLVAGTMRRYEYDARLFLTRCTERGGHGDLDLRRLAADTVTAFMADECRRRSSAAAKTLATSLRSLLRFCYLDGLTDGPLASAVPGVAAWRGAGLPRALPAGTVSALLAGCDRHTVLGRRDYAVLVLLVRLGLRVGEVAGLELGDVDWREGQITIRGKGRCVDRLPLPVDVGQALTGYLCHARPRVTCRAVFVRVLAPHRALTPNGVASVVAHACDRAGLPRVGAHRLRHTAATEMLRAGAGLAEIAQVLRHTDVSTTAGYAKVDRVALRQLALPWPGGAA